MSGHDMLEPMEPQVADSPEAIPEYEAELCQVLDFSSREELETLQEAYRMCNLYSRVSSYGSDPELRQVVIKKHGLSFGATEEEVKNHIVLDMLLASMKESYIARTRS